MQWLAAAHLATFVAALSPFPARQNSQQDCLVPHFFWHSWMVGIHLGSFSHFSYSLGHFSFTHSIGSAIRATALLKSSAGFSPKQWLEAAHLARLMASLSPLEARHSCQQDVFVPHFCWQAWISGMH